MQTKEQDYILNRIVKNKKSGCWEWTAHRNKDGYGALKFRGRHWKAHRFSYTVFVGPIKSANVVMHLCHNPRCVNPEHLRQGKHIQNMRDKVASNRQVKGSAVWSSKITEKTAPILRSFMKRNGNGSVGFLARWLRLSPSTLKNLKQRRTWKHVG